MGLDGWFAIARRGKSVLPCWPRKMHVVEREKIRLMAVPVWASAERCSARVISGRGGACNNSLAAVLRSLD
jgi:hypothetical protein